MTTTESPLIFLAALVLSLVLYVIVHRVRVTMARRRSMAAHPAGRGRVL